MNEQENMVIYNQLRQVPKEALRQFNNGRFSGTNVNDMWRIKKMTELFGPCGLGWYLEVTDRHIETAPDGNTKSAFVAIKLYVRERQENEWSAPIYGEGGANFTQLTSKGYLQVSDEAYKMALTDAFSNATKRLGLAADVWFEKDTSKYTQQAPTQPQPQQATPAVELTEQQKRRRAIDYLKDNSVALSYYCEKYGASDIYTIKDEDLLKIYNNLFKNGKI